MKSVQCPADSSNDSEKKYKRRMKIFIWQPAAMLLNIGMNMGKKVELNNVQLSFILYFIFSHSVTFSRSLI